MKTVRTVFPILFTLVGSLALCLPSAVAAADEARLDLKPGRWEITSEVESAIVGQPKSAFKNECLKTGDPLPIMVKSPCRAEDRVVKDGVLTWKIVCDTKEGAPSIGGKGELRNEAPGFRGVTEVTITVGDKKIETKSNWFGKRLGDCEK
jgi:hypothetical protein